MPPFKVGLRKRNLDTEKNVDERAGRSVKLHHNEDDEYLFSGQINQSDSDESDTDGEEPSTNDTYDENTQSKDNSSEISYESSSDLTDSDEDDSEDDSDSGDDTIVDSDTSKNQIDKTNNTKLKTTSKSENKKKNFNKVHPQGYNKRNKIRDKKVNSVKSNDDNEDTLADLQKNIDDNCVIDNKDEYQSGDSSDEEGLINTAGDIPRWWYNDYPHVGYDHDGRRILKPPQRDHIDEFLKRCEDPEFWRTVKDPDTGQDVVLSKQDLELIARIRESRPPNPQHNEHDPWVEWFSSEVMATPLRAFPEHKRSFLPSREDQKHISRLVHALKMGWIKTRRQISKERKRSKVKHFYNLWGAKNAPEQEEHIRSIHKHIPAPRRPLPSHAESYNPPPEYLLDNKEMKEWEKLSTTPWKRKYTFLPTKHSSLRHVPAYDRYVRERFLRCLDLYLAPRAIKMRLTITPEDLVPKLPSPRELQPFPTSEALVFRGHIGLVRSVGFDPTGQYIVSGGDDKTLRVWETSTGRCLRTIQLAGDGEADGENIGVRCVAWTPVTGLSLVAVALGDRLMFVNPGAGIGDHKVAETTDNLLEEPPPQHDTIVDERTRTATWWDRVQPEEWARGVRVAVKHFKKIQNLSWHGRGDYICCTLPEGASRAVVVHQLSRRRSQLPFTKAKGLVQCAKFHPQRPYIFVASQRAVRIYDLVKQQLVKKLLTGAQWISTIAIHPAGDNILVASYDRKCMWFDLDLSSKPYQTLRLHGSAVRAVEYHKRYPLFASGGDDRQIIVSHGMVYNDLLQNPLIVPLKQLYGHEPKDELCILDLCFHPNQPWLLSAGADSTLRLFT